MKNRGSKICGAKHILMAGIAFALFAGGITPACAQGDTVLTRFTHNDAAIKLVTSLWDVDTIAKTPKKSKKAAAYRNKSGIYEISGEDRYLKKKEAGKRYAEFQVFDIKGLDNDEITFGLVTNTLDRDTRYEDKGDMAKRTDLSVGYLGKLENNVVSLVYDGDSKVPIQAIRFRDKYFLILGKNDYRYLDGKKLVGDQKVIDGLMKGKPITEITFLYELQDAGLINKNITARQFTKMSVDEKQKLLSNDMMVSSL